LVCDTDCGVMEPEERVAELVARRLGARVSF
jgi:hypothetical protein